MIRWKYVALGIALTPFIVVGFLAGFVAAVGPLWP